MSILIKNIQCVDPRTGLNGVRDVLIENGKIAKVEAGLQVQAATVIDGTGLQLWPGIIDVHVHFREPGFEQKETIATGIQAALNSGVVACVAMPNTNPPCDSSSVVDFIINQGKKYAFNIFACGTMTRDRKGKELSEMADLKRAGAVAVSDDGGCVENALLMRRVMEYASMLGLPLMIHAEDSSLSMNGVMHEGIMSTQLGLKGIPSMCEYAIVQRDIELSRLTGARIHFQHISCKESVDVIRRAKQDGLPVTCEVTPHHLMLTDRELSKYDTTFKMNPPLRTENDRLALVQGVVDGTIDMVATDHAPHLQDEKDVEITFAPFGCIGMETSLSVALTVLLHNGTIGVERLVELMNVNAARLIGRPALGAIAVGNDANLTIVDVNKTWQVDSSRFKSKARNCPFNGMTLKGRAVKTVCQGTVYDVG